ncbi:MAG: hypothetical protein ABIU63_09525 [Chitinophagaceae bacterium]
MMDATITKLKMVPAVGNSTQECLLYIAAQEQVINIKIVTNGGLSYRGSILAMGTTSMAGAGIVLELVDGKRQHIGSQLHIAVARIASVEVFADEAVYFTGLNPHNTRNEILDEHRA